MSFYTDIYPYACNRDELITRLLQKASSSEWRTVDPNHRRRVEALLRAWRREITDRYLDLALLGNIRMRGPYRSLHQVFDLIRQNSPPGAVWFIRNAIEESRTWPFFGRNLTVFVDTARQHFDYNDYFGQLLQWDNDHCHGLLPKLSDELSGARPQDYVWQAAGRWIAQNQRIGVYRYYHIEWASRL